MQRQCSAAQRIGPPANPAAARPARPPPDLRWWPHRRHSNPCIGHLSSQGSKCRVFGPAYLQPSDCLSTTIRRSPLTPPASAARANRAGCPRVVCFITSTPVARVCLGPLSPRHTATTRRRALLTRHGEDTRNTGAVRFERLEPLGSISTQTTEHRGRLDWAYATRFVTIDDD